MSETRAATTTTRRSTRFVAWTRAWRAGLVPYDDVADEIAGSEEHVVADAPGTWTDTTLRDTLPLLAKVSPDDIRVVLPAAGDPVGLPGPGPFTGAALLEGEGVLAGPYGFVPEVRDHTSGSGDVFTTVRWQVFVLPTALPPAIGPGPTEAEADLNAALLSATAELTRLDVAQWRPELAGALAALRAPTTAPSCRPATTLARAACSLARACWTGSWPWPTRLRRAARSTAMRRGPAMTCCGRWPPPAGTRWPPPATPPCSSRTRQAAPLVIAVIAVSSWVIHSGGRFVRDSDHNRPR